MLSSRAISLSLLAISVDQSKLTGGMVHPNPAASSISKWMCEAITSSFFGTQPRITQVPPIRYSSATMTFAPWLAAMRAARTPPEPPPITNRSTSNSAISPPTLLLPLQASDRLVALAHLGAELRGHGVGELRSPLVHGGHAHLDRLRLGRKQ